LATNLITILVFKQVGVNLAEWAQDKFLIGRKIKKVKTYFDQKVGTLDKEDILVVEDMRMHQHMEE